MHNLGRASQTVLRAASPEAIQEAAMVLRRGGLVAFPTETVYGVGAAAFNRAAVGGIYRIKGRPADNPLIVHISTMEMLWDITVDVPAAANHLMDAFWPGPLTLVLRRAPGVPEIVSAGLDTIAVRVPQHLVALNLINAVGQPIAAPSANRSGRPSPTLASHVLQELGESVDLILDGGPCLVGVESTVLDLTSIQPVLLRPGGVPKEDIEQVYGADVAFASNGEVARSPGLKHRHYSPRCRVVLFSQSGRPALAHEEFRGQRLGVLCRSHVPFDSTQIAFFRRVDGDAAAYARVLFAVLREAEAAGIEVLFVERIDENGIGRAVMDRLQRASIAFNESADAAG